MANLSPDGTKVVTAERTGIVGLWDAATGKQIRLLRGHGDQIHDARFSPDGKTIASARATERRGRGMPRQVRRSPCISSKGVPT